MLAIESITSPFAILFDDGTKKLAAACFRHELGLLYFDPFWHQQMPDQAAHLIKGTLKGNDPWRIEGATIRLLGCQNTDPELQTLNSTWSDFLKTAVDYPPLEQIHEIARRLGAIIEE
jgi:hypothetical protein